MRIPFPDKVEVGRITTAHDPFRGTSRGMSYGSFRIRLKTKAKALVIAVDGDETGWEHVSVSLRDKRCPSWKEMCEIKDLFWLPTETVVQYHPAVENYVNIHPFCLHLWAPTRDELPLPPTWTIGDPRIGTVRNSAELLQRLLELKDEDR